MKTHTALCFDKVTTEEIDSALAQLTTMDLDALEDFFDDGEVTRVDARPLSMAELVNGGAL